MPVPAAACGRDAAFVVTPPHAEGTTVQYIPPRGVLLTYSMYYTLSTHTPV